MAAVFLYFLIYTFFSEVIGSYLGLYLKVNNNFVYNTWPIVNFLFLSILFLNKIESKKKRLIIKFLICVYSKISTIIGGYEYVN